jgi:hypothetical protein
MSTTTTTTAQDRLTRAIDTSEIHAIIHRYAILARENAPFDTAMQGLFVAPGTDTGAGGVFHLPDGRAVAAAEIGAVVRGNPPSYIRHHVTSIDVRFDDHDEDGTKNKEGADKEGGKAHPGGSGSGSGHWRRATSTAQFFANTHRTAMDHWGAWEDVWRWDGESGWRIAERVVRVEGWAEGGWYAEAYGSGSKD